MLQPMRALVPYSHRMRSRPLRGARRVRRRAFPLRHTEDWRTLMFLGLLGVLFFLQWTGILRHWSLFAATCVLSFVAYIVKHNHIHCRTFTNRIWNRGLDHILGFCTGQSTASVIPVHNERHHAQNHSEEDLVRSTLVNYRRNWLNLAVFPFRVVWLVRQTKSGDITRWRRQKPELWRRVRQERLAIRLFLAVLLILDWKATLLYFGIPWLFGQWGIVTINLLQHQDCDHDSEFNHSRNITGRFANWLFLNNGFHTAHHLRPAMHWSRLPEFHVKYVQSNMRCELNQRSLLVCVWRQFFFPAHRRQT